MSSVRRQLNRRGDELELYSLDDAVGEAVLPVVRVEPVVERVPSPNDAVTVPVARVGGGNGAMTTTTSPVPRRPYQHSPLREAIDDARFHEVALLVLNGVRSRVDLCARTGMSNAQLTRILDTNRDRFNAIYVELRNELVGSLREIATDESRERLLRDAALAEQSRTMVANIMTLVERRVAQGKATAAEMRVGVSAYSSVVDRTDLTRHARHGQAAMNVAVFAPTVYQSRIIEETAREVGAVLDTVAAPVVEGDSDGE